MKGCYATDAEIQDFSDIRRSPAWLTFNECGHFYREEDFLQGEETGNMANPSDVVPKIKRL